MIWFVSLMRQTETRASFRNALLLRAVLFAGNRSRFLRLHVDVYVNAGVIFF